jgi:hypothetical protein
MTFQSHLLAGEADRIWFMWGKSQVMRGLLPVLDKTDFEARQQITIENHYKERQEFECRDGHSQ